jgi:magnesium-protoporphyrin O-methyltransferase
MHRVVCCYPEAGRLMEVAAERAERLLVLSFPRERPLPRLVNRLGNLWMRARGIPFRSYVHSERAIESAAEQRGLRLVAERRGRIWRAVAFERG